MAKPKTIYQLKVTLKEIKPAIWRRLQVPADIKLDKLHDDSNVILRASRSRRQYEWVRA